LQARIEVHPLFLPAVARGRDSSSREAHTKSSYQKPSLDGSTRIATERAVDVERTNAPTQAGLSSRRAKSREKLSINVNHAISERLRSLAYTYRLSESSIVEIALTIFFARGDDTMLGVLLKELGATLRTKS